MRNARFAPVAVCLVLCLTAVQAADYPLTLGGQLLRSARAPRQSRSKLTIQVDRLMNQTYRQRVTDALKFGGYPNFLKQLRALPVIGAIDLDGRKVELRYAHEEPRDGGSRLVLAADAPLFFLGSPAKAKAGYELTLVELTLDAQASGKGTMTGAARVKPTPDGGLVVDDFASAPVQLAVRRDPGEVRRSPASGTATTTCGGTVTAGRERPAHCPPDQSER